MKGVFIHKQLEFRLDVAGEDFCQGDSLKCTLTVKNHAGAPQSPGGLRVALMDADLKKLKDRKPEALRLISCQDFAEVPEILPQAQQSFDWTVTLDRNCTISDKNQSLCFVYGSMSDEAASAQLPFTVVAHRHTQKIVSFFESPFQFVVKGQKSAHGEVQVKMKPPTERRLSLVEELLLGFRFEGDALFLNYHFRVKAFDTTATSLNVKKNKTEVSQRLEPGEYLLGEYLNHEFLEKRVEEALTVVATGI